MLVNRPSDRTRTERLPINPAELCSDHIDCSIQTRLPKSHILNGPTFRKAKDILAADADKLKSALDLCFFDYNNMGLAKEQQKFKLIEYDQLHIRNLIFGVDAPVLHALKLHLDDHKEDSAGQRKRSTNY